MQLKHPDIHLRKFIVLSTIAVLVSGQNGKIVAGARKKELGAWCENGGEDRA